MKYFYVFQLRKRFMIHAANNCNAPTIWVKMPIVNPVSKDVNAKMELILIKNQTTALN